jgi:hypothetical protein
MNNQQQQQQQTISERIIHVFGHANGVKTIEKLLSYFKPLAIEYHARREELEHISQFKDREIWLVIVKQNSISPVVFGADGDFPEIQDPQTFGIFLYLKLFS